ncbi:MAG: thiaminase II [Nitrososphaerota archaeon]
MAEVRSGRPREVLWRSIDDVYRAILEHPFVRGLSDGSLPEDRFREYIVQDALYLSSFSRAVAIVGTKAPDDDGSLTLLENAVGALRVERASLHEFLMREWGVKPEELRSRVMSPVNLAYTSYLIAAASSGSFEEGLAAILPCFWVYYEVGKELVRRGSEVPVYRRWIETYSSPEYERAVMAVVGLADEHLAGLTGNRLRAVLGHFRTSSIYEYLFFDEAYRGWSWPFSPQPSEYPL